MAYKKRKSIFNKDILKENDGNGDIISAWCTPGFKPEEAICFICNHTISCSQHGVSAVKRHAVSKTHQEKCSSLRDSSGKLKNQTKNQTFLLPTKSSQLWNSPNISNKDKVTIAETKFAITVAVNNVSYSAASAVADLFPHIFDDSVIARDFTCSRNKLSYIISDGLGPYFKEQVINEICRTQCYYSVQVDETPIPEKRVQQMDIIVRYYSEEKQMLVYEHLNSVFLGSATSDVMFGHVTDALASLPKDKLLCFFSDGPNVMKSLHEKISESYKYILRMGTCSLHKVHNVFVNGLSAFDEVEEFCLDIYYFFKQSAVRSENFRDMQLGLGLPEHIFLRHVQNRWLTLHLAIDRIIEQFPSLEVFFLNSQCHTTNMRSMNTDRFLRINRALRSKTFFAKLLFLKNSAELFTGFLKLFQQDGPLLHILYDEICELTKKVLGRFLQPEAFRNLNGSDLKNLHLEKNWLKKPEIGLDTECALQKASESERKEFYLNARLFYKRCALKLLKTMPLGSKILKSLRCLHPLCRTEDFSAQDIKYLVSQVPSVIPPSMVSSVADEWIMFQSENIDSSVFLKQLPEKAEFLDKENDEVDILHENNFVRLDVYWKHVFDLKDRLGKTKYPLLTKLVKALISLPHGNAEVERGFSENKRLLNSRSQMSIATINGLRHINSCMKRYDNDCRNLNINFPLIKAVRQAYQKYRNRIETESVKRKECQIKNNATELQNLKKKEEFVRNNLETSQKMLDNAEKLISDGILSKDFSKIQSGQVILQDSKEKLECYMKELKKTEEEIERAKGKKKKHV